LKESFAAWPGKLFIIIGLAKMIRNIHANGRYPAKYRNQLVPISILGKYLFSSLSIIKKLDPKAKSPVKSNA